MSVLYCGDPAVTAAGTEMIHKRQEGNPIQHDFAQHDLAGGGSNFYNLTPGSLFLTCLSTKPLWKKKFSCDNYHNKALGRTVLKLFCNVLGTSSTKTGSTH